MHALLGVIFVFLINATTLWFDLVARCLYSKFFLAGYSSCYTNLIFYTKQFIFNANMFQQTASAIIRAVF